MYLADQKRMPQKPGPWDGLTYGKYSSNTPPPIGFKRNANDPGYKPPAKYPAGMYDNGMSNAQPKQGQDAGSDPLAFIKNDVGVVQGSLPAPPTDIPSQYRAYGSPLAQEVPVAQPVEAPVKLSILGFSPKDLQPKRAMSIYSEKAGPMAPQSVGFAPQDQSVQQFTGQGASKTVR